MGTAIDLNADLGEGYGQDARLLELVSSVSVACGFHAGDPGLMREVVALAGRKQVQVGAHPGFPDREGMGRRDMELTPDEIYDLTLYQIGALDAFARRAGLRLQHVKPHGSLYNMAARRPAYAHALVAATIDYAKDLVFVGLPFSEMEAAARRAGARFAAGAFADRTYQADGTLTPRGRPDAFVRDPRAAAQRAVDMVHEGRVQATGGEWVTLHAHTICLHGDNPEAVTFAETLRRALADAGIAVRPLSAVVP